MYYHTEVNKVRDSLLEGIYNLNRHADKRCYYLHRWWPRYADMMCQGIYANVRGREGASQALKLGYQAALTMTTLPHCCCCKSNSHPVSLCSQRGVHDKRLPLKLLQPRFCPHSWFLPSGARLLFIQEIFVTGWLHERDFFDSVLQMLL